MPATLLFLPGTLCDSRVWARSCEALREEWPRVSADYRLAESVSAMAAAALAQVEGDVVPIGISMGGMVALEIWRQEPRRVRALALFGTDAGPDTQDRRARRDANVLAATHGQFRAMVETKLVPAYFGHLDSPDPVLRDACVAMALDQGVGAFAAQATALATRPDSWRLLGGIAVPTLVACGSEDRVCLPEWHERMTALLPRATFTRIPASGHLAPLEQPDTVGRILRSWLNELKTNSRIH